MTHPFIHQLKFVGVSMLKLNSKALFWAGLAAGVLLTLIVWGVFHSSVSHGKHEIAAELQEEKLTYGELRQRTAERLIPIQNDEYRLLHQAVENWMDDHVLQREAKARGLTTAKLYQQEIWSRVQVSLNDAHNEYNRNRELYNQSFEKVQDELVKSLRNRRYAEVKQKYLGSLREKYGAKNFLQKPDFYVEGLGVAPVAVQGQAGDARPVKKSPPVVAAAAQNLPSSIPVQDLAGRPSRGPADAPVTIIEFSDFHCPFCKRVQPTLDQLMQNYPGKIRHIWRHLPLSIHPGADRVHEASECAAEQNKFWEFHDKVFENQQAARGDDTLIGIAAQAGLDQGKFKECLQSGKFKDLIQQEITKGGQAGARGTPAFFVNDQFISGAQPYANFERAVESILNPGKVQPLPPAPRDGSGGARPQAQKVVQFDDLEGKPAIGPKDAPVTIVEFSDFHCPFCQRVQPTIDQLMKNYEGKIRRVWRHYPLPFHQGADRVHEASECAAEQDKFWEFHGNVFENPQAAKGDDALIGLAKQTGLNEKKFKGCLESGKYKDLIQKEIAKGSQSGVSGTPAFFINGRLLSGAQPYASFDNVVKSELQKETGS